MRCNFAHGPQSVRKLRGVEFLNIAGLPRVPNRRESAGRYLHAKVLWFRASDGDLVVTGSANPSAPAFLSREDTGTQKRLSLIGDRVQQKRWASTPWLLRRASLRMIGLG
jgi:hypothetical protein